MLLSRITSGLRRRARFVSSVAVPDNKTIFIDNEYVSADTGQTLPVHSPHNNQQFAAIANASESDVDRAVLSAKRCLGSDWGHLNTTPEDRAGILRKMADALESQTQHFAEVNRSSIVSPSARPPPPSL